MSSLPTWASWAIVAACPLLGPVIAFLVFLAVVVLDRWITGAREDLALVPVAASNMSRFLRRKLSLLLDIGHQSTREPVRDEPVSFAAPPM
jgi:hypothetical protein